VARHAPLVAVLVAFAAAAFLVPTLAPVATTDDWGYSRSVEILYHEGKLTVFPVVAASAVFQIVWGWLFALLFGMSLGVMRVATVVMVGCGGVALYALLRELGASRGRSALGAATYLFNPLAFVLAYTFMTDPVFTSLLVISTFFYVRGLRDAPSAAAVTLTGSAVAACAFLTRQQGALIPIAVVCFLVLARRVGPNRAGLAAGARAALVPAVAAVAYYLWLRYLNEVPRVQEGFLEEALHSGVDGAWRLVRHLTVIELMYLGFFLLPVAAGLIPALRDLVGTMRLAGWMLFAIAPAILATGLVAYALEGKWMPYVGQFAGRGGLGAPDVRGSRPGLLDAELRQLITAVCAVSIVVVALALCRGLAAAATPERTAAGLVLVIALWQVIGILPPSFHYLQRGYSLDRYLLPLLPLGIGLIFWATRDVRLSQPLSWVAVALFAAYAVAGTRDYLVYMDAVWTVARGANAAGVAHHRLDAGAAWDGYHLYTYGLENGITKARTRDGPWWVYFYGKATDSTYVVAGRPLDGYVIVSAHPYSSWLHAEPTVLYLLRRADVPGPP
jgi:hypothetical protein